MAPTTPQAQLRRLRSQLPAELFTPRPLRALWLVPHLLLVGMGLYAVNRLLDAGHHLAALLPSMVIGLAFAGLAFVGHEALHGAITRRPALKRWIGRIGFAPFCVPPRLWIGWHNRVHHGNTNVPGVDPDAYPTREEYDADAITRLSVDLAAPRGGRLRGLITLLLGFSLQSTHMLLSASKKGILSKRQQRKAWFEAAATWVVWFSLFPLLGLDAFLYGYVLPLAMGNAIVMSLIITNHSLSPLATENDTLATSLTVTMPKLLEVYTLGFGYHVEHHLFPAMSHREAPRVAQLLRAEYPGQYQSMGFGRALWLLFTTPRVYETSHLLYDPTDGTSHKTLGAPHTSPTEELMSSGRTSPSITPAGRVDTPQLVSMTKESTQSAPRAHRWSSVPPPAA